MFRITLIATAVGAACSASPLATSAFAADVRLQATTERLNSPQLGQIRADPAHIQGYTGNRVTIAILDTGLNTSHIEFRTTGKLLQGYNAIDAGSNVTDRHGHGTHVTGIAAALRNSSGMMGVAFDARILPIKVLDDSGYGSTSWIDRGLRYAVGKASIASLSLTSSGAYSTAGTRVAVDSGLLIVAAAGNSGGAHPEWPARFAKEYWANGQIIAVGAVDSGNRIASFSNRAGDTATWFLVAPGVNIYSSYQSAYTRMSGTSMATPVVAGAAAVVKQHWPWLTAKKVAQVLLQSATDLGATGVDPIYGRGLVNLERAMQPIGGLTTTTASGASLTLSGSILKTNSASSGLLQLAASGGLRITGLDDFQRDFGVDLGANITRPSGLSVAQVFGRLDRRIELAERILPDGSRLMAVHDHKVLPVYPGGVYEKHLPATRLAGFAWTSAEFDGRRLAFGNGGFASHSFGAGGLDQAGSPALAGTAALANPYFALVPRAAHAALSQRFSDGTRLSLGVLTSAFEPMMAAQWGAGSAPTPKAHSSLVELSRSFGKAAVAATVSQTAETDSWLGARSGGALSLGSNASTSALQLTGAWRLAPQVAIAAQYAMGFTPAASRSDGTIMQLSSARTNAASLALVAAGLWAKGDRLSLSVAQPMRTYAGSVSVNAIHSVDQEGNPVRATLQRSLVPDGREILTEASYMAPTGARSALGLSLSLRHQPDHFANAPSEKMVALRYTGRF